ncbi:hypothetical protein QBE55_07170 [Eubacteriales bacterium mix99]
MDILKQAREQCEKEARPAAFKVRVQNPKQSSIKQQLAAVLDLYHVAVQAAGAQAEKAKPQKRKSAKKYYFL